MYDEYSEEEIVLAMNSGLLQLKILLSQIMSLLRETEIYDATLSLDVIDNIGSLDLSIIGLTKEYLLRQGYSEEDIAKMTEQAKKAFGF